MKKFILSLVLLFITSICYGAPAFRIVDTAGHELEINSDGTIPTSGGGSVSDAVYGSGWNGDTTVAPSKNAVYDKIETVVAGTTSYDQIGDPVANGIINFSTFQNAWTSTRGAEDFFRITTNGILTDGSGLMHFVEGTGNPTGGSFINFTNSDGDLSDIGGDGKLVFDPNGSGTTTEQVDFDSTPDSLIIGKSAGGSYAGLASTLIGQSAGFYLTTGSYMTAVGYRSCRGNIVDQAITGDYNDCFGRESGLSLSTGHHNTFLGMGAGSNVTTGERIIAIGVDAYKDDTGTYDIGIGYHSGYLLTASGSGNVFIGHNGSDAITTATDVITIGRGANPADSLTAAGCIGTNCVVSASNRFVIGGASTKRMDLIVTPATTQAVTAAATITADSCGTIKRINSTGAQTTNTTDTFTNATTAGCCMDVVNVDTADAITLDFNANFKSAGGADVVLGINDTARVCSDGAVWYQVGATGNN